MVDVPMMVTPAGAHQILGASWVSPFGVTSSSLKAVDSICAELGAINSRGRDMSVDLTPISRRP